MSNLNKSEFNKSLASKGLPKKPDISTVKPMIAGIAASLIANHSTLSSNSAIPPVSKVLKKPKSEIKFNHDFEISSAKFNVVPGFKIKNLGDTSNASISPILKQLKSLVGSFGFTAEENRTVIGKSGNSYRINIYGEDENKRTLFIFIRNHSAENDNSELNSKII